MYKEEKWCSEIRQLVQSHAVINYEAEKQTQVILWLKWGSTQWKEHPKLKHWMACSNYSFKWESKKKVNDMKWQKTSKTSGILWIFEQEKKIP